jgi:hypothetical protein
MTAIRQLKRRTLDSNQISALSSKLDLLNQALQKLLEKRMGTTESLSDQERSHTVPAYEMNDSMPRAYIDVDFDDKQRELGKAWARKYNPHYKR